MRPIITKIGKVTMGGELGEHPTVLVGSIFYDRHKIVKDGKEGLFDETEAERLIKAQENWSKLTGNPCMVDIVASTAKAMVRYVDFVSEVTESPIMIDGTSAEAKIAGLVRCAEKKILDRVVYNSLTPEYTEEETPTLRDVGVKNIVLLCFNSRDFSLQGRLDVLEGRGERKGLLELAQDLGVENILVDTAIIDVPSLGIAKRMIEIVKEKYGLCVGSAAHNAIGTWGGLKEKMGEEAIRPCIAVVDALGTAWGGDFLIYGPLANAGLVFPAVALVDACLGQLRLEEGKMPDTEHPLFKIA